MASQALNRWLLCRFRASINPGLGAQPGTSDQESYVGNQTFCESQRLADVVAGLSFSV